MRLGWVVTPVGGKEQLDHRPLPSSWDGAGERLAYVVVAFNGVQSARRAASEREGEHAGRVPGGEDLGDAPAHGGAVYVGPLDLELVEDGDGIRREAFGRQVPAGVLSATGPAVVHGDGAEPVLVPVTDAGPPCVGARLALKEQQRGPVRATHSTAALDAQAGTVRAGNIDDVKVAHELSVLCVRVDGRSASSVPQCRPMGLPGRGA